MEKIKLLIGKDDIEYFGHANQALIFGNVTIQDDGKEIYAIIEATTFQDICRLTMMAGYFKGAETTKKIYSK